MVEGQVVQHIRPGVIPAERLFEIHTVYDKPMLSYRQYMAPLGFEHF